MRRRQFLGSAAAVVMAAKRTAAEPALGSPASLCDCSFMQARPAGPEGASGPEDPHGACRHRPATPSRPSIRLAAKRVLRWL